MTGPAPSGIITRDRRIERPVDVRCISGSPALSRTKYNMFNFYSRYFRMKPTPEAAGKPVKPQKLSCCAVWRPRQSSSKASFRSVSPNAPPSEQAALTPMSTYKICNQHQLKPTRRLSEIIKAFVVSDHLFLGVDRPRVAMHHNCHYFYS